MAEAVIVATARTPIGRAFKGSLKDVRPDDLAATAIRAVLDKVPALDPDRHHREGEADREEGQGGAEVRCGETAAFPP